MSERGGLFQRSGCLQAILMKTNGPLLASRTAEMTLDNMDKQASINMSWELGHNSLSGCTFSLFIINIFMLFFHSFIFPNSLKGS